MKVTGYSRPHPSEIENGDYWFSIDTQDSLRVAVIDGAGHGPSAATVAAKAAEVIRASKNKRLVDVLRDCHQSLLGTRGAVLSLVEVADGQLTFVGVGNVDGLYVDASKTQRFLPDRGMLGAALPTPKPLVIALNEPWAFVIHTDGVSPRMGNAVLNAESIIEDPELFARTAVESWGRNSDDATVVVVQA